MTENILLLTKSNIKKSIKTSVAFFLLIVVTILLSYTGNQLTEGLKWLYEKKIAETNSADFAAVLPYDFYEKYRMEITEFQKKNKDISELEITGALLLRNVDIKTGNREAINGSWTFRNADRKERLSSLKIISSLDRIPENGIYVPYVCKTFFGFQLGDDLQILSGEWQETFVIAGFTEDVLFGSRSNLIFDLPERQFHDLKVKAGQDAEAVIVSMLSSGKSGEISNRFSEFVASKADEIIFYASSDTEYAEISRNNNINIYVTIINIASFIGLLICFIMIGFHMRNTLDEDLKELGTLKAIGYKGSEIATSYILQFLALGVSGTIIGIVISQVIMPVIISNIANDIGFEWENPPIGFTSIRNILVILLLIAAFTLFLSRGIIKLRPVEAFQERGKISGCKKSRITIERIPFPINLSITLKMIDYGRIKSILISMILAAIMIVAGFAVILYAKLVVDKDGLLQITGAEVYSVNVQAAHPEEIDEIANEIKQIEDVKLMTAIEPGSSRLLCEESIYASLAVYSDYASLENPSLYSGRYPKHENEVTISGNLSQMLGKEIGDTIKISNIFEEDAKEANFIVVGLTQGTYTGGLDIYLTMDGLKMIEPLAEWQSIHVYLDEKVNMEKYCLDLKKHFSERISYVGEFEKIFYSQFSPIINSVTGIVVFIMIGIFLLIIIMGFFVTNSILLTQKKNFGIMKALGYSTRQIISQAVMTFMLYVAGGSILGSFFLFFCANTIISTLFHGMGVYKVDFSFPVISIVILFLCIGVVGSLTAFISAWKIRKIVPCNLIKVE